MLLLLASCTKIETPMPTQIDLGKLSTASSIVDVSPIVTTGIVNLTIKATAGSKYSLQLIDLKGDVRNSLGFLANEDTIMKKLNYSDISNGDYVITLIDISGREMKRNITIKH